MFLYCNLIGMMAIDLEQNAGLAWLELNSVENTPPRLAAAVLPNPLLPTQFDLVWLSDEPLRSLQVWRASNGLALVSVRRAGGEDDARCEPDGESGYDRGVRQEQEEDD